MMLSDICKLLYFIGCWFCCERKVFPFIYCSVLVLGHRKQLGGGNNPGPPGMSWAEIIPPLPNYVHLPRIPKRLFLRPNNPNVATVNWESNIFYQRTRTFFCKTTLFPFSDTQNEPSDSVIRQFLWRTKDLFLSLVSQPASSIEGPFRPGKKDFAGLPNVIKIIKKTPHVPKHHYLLFIFPQK